MNITDVMSGVADTLSNLTTNTSAAAKRVTDIPHEATHNIPHEHHRVRVGGWMPADHRLHNEWLGKQVEHVKDNRKPLNPVLQEFKDLIEKDARLYMYFTAMFDEIPNKKPYKSDPTGNNRQIHSYEQMLDVLNHVLTTAPHWTSSAEKVGFVGVPMNAVFDWPMGTPSGNAAFLDPQVNAMLKKVLNEWGKYLKSPESAKVLGRDKHGWLGEVAQKDITAVANGASGASHKFQDMFQCDPNVEHYGYTSWDDFFTRKLQDGARPIASPEDENIIVSACESKPYNIQRNCKLRDKFWAKGQPYSIVDMLGHDELSSEFANGTVYQAFLSALSYHRWHAPVNGTIKKAFVVDGTYFSEPLWEGLGDPASRHEIDVKGITTGQGYIAQMATRAIIFIEADNPAIGLMAFVGIGMDEVSTCEITVKEGQKVKKGDELGMFHFGGSSHTLVFRPQVNLEFVAKPGQEQNMPVNAEVARVISR